MTKHKYNPDKRGVWYRYIHLLTAPTRGSRWYVWDYLPYEETVVIRHRKTGNTCTFNGPQGIEDCALFLWCDCGLLGNG